VSRRKLAEFGLVMNTVVWGATFVLVKSALDDVTPLLFLALRFSLASIVLVLALGWRASKGFTWRSAGAGALVGGFLYMGYLLQTVGLRLTTAPKSAFITGLCSVMVPLLAALVYRIRPQVPELAGVFAATAGLGLMTLEGPLGSMGRGDLLTLGCAVAFAAQIVTQGHFVDEMSFELLAVSQIVSAAVLSLSLFWWAEKPVIVWRPMVVYAILITGLLATAGAFALQAWAQQHTTATRTALIFTLEPVFAWVTSYVLVGEGLSGRGAAGAVLILGGVLWVEMKPWNPRPHPSR
jgi:drug/metabolite transporter (DMT)-like permease